MMILSVMKMRRISSNICDNPGYNDGNLADVIPTEKDFDRFEECVDIMVSVVKVFEAFSADNYPTTNRVKCLFSEIQPAIQKKLAQEGG